ncbi:hypothetical protein B0T17DRAFT_602869 [Bombardia bombarda]|uniref:Uncharacterized protein n=1 Tax=Bombardia bombarda TaxID=252184 RepID=A0AA39WAQ6_9PEZI|nr:hypothetical protein B0T17DRAFT_602869 [Bombardia bombarda]
MLVNKLYEQKPLDVLEPIQVDSSLWKNQLAYMVSDALHHDFSHSLIIYPNPDSLQEWEILIAQKIDKDFAEGIRHLIDTETNMLRRVKWVNPPSDETCYLRLGEVLHCGIGPGTDLEIAGSDTENVQRRPFMPEDRVRLQRVAAFVQPQEKNKAIRWPTNSLRARSLYTIDIDGTSCPHSSDDMSHMVLPHNPDENTPRYSLWLWLSAVTLPLIFGVVHLAAWNFQFGDTKTEKIWKVSCFCIIFAIPVIRLLSGFRTLFGVVFPSTKASWVVWSIFALVDVAILFLVMSVRVILVTLCLISIVWKDNPIGVFLNLTPWWIQIIPHI